MVLALDPGPKQTGWATWDGMRLWGSGVTDNDKLLATIDNDDFMQQHMMSDTVLAIEMIASYGMAVGREVFETCVWIGRFQQQWWQPDRVMKVYRQEVKTLLCKSTKAKDANVRAAIIDLFPGTGRGATPQIGTKKHPGPLFGVSSHAWPAIGVAMVAIERMKHEAAGTVSKRPPSRRVALRGV